VGLWTISNGLLGQEKRMSSGHHQRSPLISWASASVADLRLKQKVIHLQNAGKCGGYIYCGGKIHWWDPFYLCQGAIISCSLKVKR
jgi:1-acyl-sn-glycerol-3-phosphate acyltransferase